MESGDWPIPEDPGDPEPWIRCLRPFGPIVAIGPFRQVWGVVLWGPVGLWPPTVIARGIGVHCMHPVPAEARSEGR